MKIFIYPILLVLLVSCLKSPSGRRTIINSKKGPLKTNQKEVDVICDGCNEAHALFKARKGDKYIFCSSAVVNKDTMVTAGHCVEGIEKIENAEFIFPDGNLLPKTIVKARKLFLHDKENDLAFIRLESGVARRPLEYGNDGLKDMERLHVFFPSNSLPV